jgi:hypothetical protein
MATIIPFPAPAPGEPDEALFLALMESPDGRVALGEVIELAGRCPAPRQDNGAQAESAQAVLF